MRLSSAPPDSECDRCNVVQKPILTSHTSTHTHTHTNTVHTESSTVISPLAYHFGTLCDGCLAAVAEQRHESVIVGTSLFNIDFI